MENDFVFYVVIYCSKSSEIDDAHVSAIMDYELPLITAIDRLLRHESFLVFP
jgi:hypothetical protein